MVCATALSSSRDDSDLGLIELPLHPVAHRRDLLARLPSRDLEQFLGVSHHQFQISHEFVPGYDIRAIHVENLLDNFNRPIPVLQEDHTRC